MSDTTTAVERRCARCGNVLGMVSYCVAKMSRSTGKSTHLTGATWATQEAFCSPECARQEVSEEAVAGESDTPNADELKRLLRDLLSLLDAPEYGCITWKLMYGEKVKEICAFWGVGPKEK